MLFIVRCCGGQVRSVVRRGCLSDLVSLAPILPARALLSLLLCHPPPTPTTGLGWGWSAPRWIASLAHVAARCITCSLSSAWLQAGCPCLFIWSKDLE